MSVEDSMLWAPIARQMSRSADGIEAVLRAGDWDSRAMESE